MTWPAKEIESMPNRWPCGFRLGSWQVHWSTPNPSSLPVNWSPARGPYQEIRQFVYVILLWRYTWAPNFYLFGKFGLTKYHKNESSMNSSLKVYVGVICLFLECLFINDLLVAPLGFFPFVQVLLFLGTCNQQDTHLAMASAKFYSYSSVDRLRPCNLSKLPQCALCKSSPTNYQSRQRQIY